MKAELRKSVLARRNRLSKEEILAHSHSVCEALKPYLKGNIGIYKACGSEIQLDSLEELNLCLSVPKTLPENQLQFYVIDDTITWRNGKFNILEPMSGNPTKNLDVLIIPLVAFDKACNRLGHGAGYYDRYLSQFHGLKIGVAHECQRCEQVYEEAHDIPLDMIVSEENIYKR